MSAASYEEIVRQILSLPATEQRRVLETLSGLVSKAGGGAASRSILELRGLGKEVWDGMDAQEYVNQERTSWNG